MDINQAKIKEISDKYLQNQFTSKEDHHIFPGKIPIMISAPHAITHYRYGKPKQSESYTGVLAELLHYHSGYHAIVKTRNNYDDPNYDKRSQYRDTLADYITSHPIHLLLDIHIMKSTNYNTIEMATGNGKNIQGKQEIIDEIISLAKKQGIAKIVSDKNFFALNPHCISADMAARTGVPSIQVELNWGKLNTEEGNTTDFLQIFHFFHEIGKHFEIQHKS